MAKYKRDIKEIKKIIVHCSDSDNPKHDTINVIRQWHKLLGWDDVGYHFFIRKSGEIQKGRQLYFEGAHCLGENHDSVGICLSGRKEFKEKQFKSCALLIHDLVDVLGWNMHGREWIDVVFPHNHFNKHKTCPNFPIEKVLHFSDQQLIDYKENEYYNMRNL